MTERLIRSIAIVGGGTAGWLAAATLARVLRGRAEISVVDGGERDDLLAGDTATLPALRSLHEILGIDETELLRRTGGTFRLGTQFDGWNAAGRGYFHPFGEIGAVLNGTPFRNHWLKLKAAGDVPDFGDFSVAGAAARAGRFTRPANDKRSVLSTLDYGWHLDAARYTALIRDLAEKNGVARVAGRVANVAAADGSVGSVTLDDERVLTAELYIDCTGVLMDALQIGIDDWSAWLPCDRIVMIDSEPLTEPPPFTTAVARGAGWQWTIPLRERTGNGLVYAGAEQSEEAAEAELRANLPSSATGDVRRLEFQSGRRRTLRQGNVVALGPAACVLEPLEGAPLQVIHIGINRLLALFPDQTHSVVEAVEYNRIAGGEMEQLRDFLILHYKTTGRGDTALWRRCCDAEVPQMLERKLAQFRSRGRVVLYDEETFGEPSWSAVMIGQGVSPGRIDPYIDTFDIELLRSQAQRIHSVIRQGAASMPSHKAFLERIHGRR